MLTQPPGLWPPPRERPLGEPNGPIQKSAPLARSVATPGAPAGRRSAEGIFIHCRLYPALQPPHRFMTIRPLKKIAMMLLRPDPHPVHRCAQLRLRLLGRSLLSFLRRVFPPYGEGLKGWAGRKLKDKNALSRTMASKRFESRTGQILETDASPQQALMGGKQKS